MAWIITLPPTKPVATNLQSTVPLASVLVNDANVAVSLTGPAAAMVALESLNGAGAATMLPPQAAGIGTESLGATASSTLQVPVAAAATTEALGAAVAATCAILASSAICTETIGATVAVTCAVPNASASCTEALNAMIAAGVPSTIAAGIAWSAAPPITTNLVQDLNTMVMSSITLGTGAPVATGTSPPSLSVLSGTPPITASFAAPYVEIDITAGGARGTALFSWKLNGVVQATNVATAATVNLAGLSLAMGAGPYATDNVYKIYGAASAWADRSGSPSSWTTSSGGAEPTVLSQDPNLNNLPAIQVAAAKEIFGALTVAQPNTVYVVGWVGLTSGGDIFDGHTTRQAIGMDATALYVYAGTILHLGVRNANMHAFCATFNGASSVGYLDSSASPVPGNAGTNSLVGPSVAGGFPSSGGGGVGRILVYSGAHTQAQVSQIFAYLGQIYGAAWA